MIITECAQKLFVPQITFGSGGGNGGATGGVGGGRTCGTPPTSPRGQRTCGTDPRGGSAIASQNNQAPANRR